MNIAESDHVLDVGCGVGGPAREIASFAGCHITGITLNQYQVNRATLYTSKRNGLSERVNFIQGNFMQMPFDDGTFDKVYAIEATCHAPTLEGVYREIHRVLKPGGTFGVYEWVLTETYNADDPDHRRVSLGIEQGDGISQLFTISDAREGLINAGFEITYEENLAQKGDVVPWYYPLAGDLTQVRSLWDLVTVFRMTRVGRFFTQTSLGLLERVGLAPKGTKRVGESLGYAADCLVEGGQRDLFTPMMLFVCKKK